jgi:hypothetical protein
MTLEHSCLLLSIDEIYSIDGWDCSFKTDAEQLSRFCDNTSSVAELLTGFFDFMAQFDFKTHAVCTRSGQAVDLQTFSNLAKIEPALARFKVQ